MNLNLKRTDYRSDGIFSELSDDLGNVIAKTLEHAYDGAEAGFVPKIPNGSYPCNRSFHKLHGMVTAFETFEILGVEGHQGLLFHWGNLNKDSEGCILLGEEIGDFDGQQGVTHSRDCFNHFMKLQTGCNTFQLMVSNA